jgi:mRNA interferase MazF
MSPSSSTPACGDIVLVQLDPVVGHEQAGIRPALVLSSDEYNRSASFILVCPITRNERPWPFKFPLPGGLRARGYVLADQIKSVDKSRLLRQIDRAPAETVDDARALLGRILGVYDTPL